VNKVNSGFLDGSLRRGRPPTIEGRASAQKNRPSQTNGRARREYPFSLGKNANEKTKGFI